MTTTPAKRLTYIVNYISADDPQHFVHIPNLLSHLEALGWSVDLLSERGGSGRSEVLGRDVTFLSMHSKFARAARLLVSLVAMRRRGGRLVFVRISRFAAFGSAILGRLLGWKTVYWLSGTVEDFDARSGLAGRIAIASMWLQLRLVDQLVTGPETMVAYYARRYGLPARKIMMLYNDIALNGTIAPDAGSKVRDVRVLLVHRLSPVRETMRYFPSIIDALERVSGTGRKLQVDVVGRGPERPQLERFIAERQSAVAVTFHGSVPNHDLGAFYRRATIFIMPSYREGFPRVILEAMARGLPIVSTDAGGTRDIFGPEQQAYVVDREDAEGFGRSIERLLSSADDRRRLSQENLAVVQRFSTPAVARMYDRTLSALIGARPAS